MPVATSRAQGAGLGESGYFGCGLDGLNDRARCWVREGEAPAEPLAQRELRPPIIALGHLGVDHSRGSYQDMADIGTGNREGRCDKDNNQIEDQ